MKRPSKKRQNDEINVIMCFRPSDFDYNDELARNGCTDSGLFVAAAINCQTMSRDLSMQVQRCPTAKLLLVTFPCKSNGDLLVCIVNVLFAFAIYFRSYLSRINRIILSKPVRSSGTFVSGSSGPIRSTGLFESLELFIATR